MRPYGGDGDDDDDEDGCLTEDAGVAPASAAPYLDGQSRCRTIAASLSMLALGAPRERQASQAQTADWSQAGTYVC